MSTEKNKQNKRIRRHQRVRAKVWGTSERPRLSVFRSNRHIWAQLIDDKSSKTLAMASDLELSGKREKAVKKSFRKTTGLQEIAGKVGELLANKAGDLKITSVVFDRGGYKYHGIVKKIAEGARQGGLKF